jgi:hypothetical protein
MDEEDIMEIDAEIKEQVVEWCNSNSYWELAQRLAFVPAALVRDMLFETPESAGKMLSEHGY